MTDSFWYPDVEDVLAIHQDIVSEYPQTSSGVRRRGEIEFALAHVQGDGSENEMQSKHDKAFHLLRYLVTGHPFVDGNKRTALNTVTVFYFLNGYRFEYDDDIRGILKQLGMDESAVDEPAAVDYLQENTHHIDLEDSISQWREELIREGLDRLTDELDDPND